MQPVPHLKDSLIKRTATAFSRLVFELQCDQRRLEGAEQRNHTTEDERRPDHKMKPIWRCENRLGEKRKPGRDRPNNKDNKHGRTISTVSNAQVEITSLAARFNSKESIKELPFAAAGAFTSQTRS